MTRALFMLLLVLASCPGKQYGEPLGATRGSMVVPLVFDAGPDVAVQRTRVSPVVTLTERSVGPYLAWNGNGGVVAYVGGKTGARGVMVVSLGPTGEPRGAARRVADVPTDAISLVLRRSDIGGPRYYLAWTSLSEKGKSLSFLAVAEDGIPAGPPVTLEQTTDDIVWLDVVPTDRGAVCVWAEQMRGGDANLLSSSTDPTGRPRGVPGAIARGVVRWQVTRAGSGVGVGVLRTLHPSSDPKAPQVGSMGWLRLDPEGRAIGGLTPIVPTDTVGFDFDIARMQSAGGDSYLFAWTDRSGPDPEVVFATLDAQGKVSPISRLDADRGGHTLVSLAGGTDGAFMVWEDARLRELPTRRAYSAFIRATATSPETRGPVLELRGTGDPETRATHDGLAWLATARACKEQPCAGAPTKPIFVRLGSKLAVDQVEIMDDAAVAGPAWSLDCAGDRCAALTASGDAETHVSFVDLSPRPSPALAPLAAAVPAALKSLTTLAVGGTISDVGFVVLANTKLIASLSHDDGGKGDDTIQTLSLRSIDGVTVGKPEVLSKRALATGSVSIVDSPEGGAVVAFVSKDGADVQVHVVRVDAHGKRVKDARVTTGASAKSDVAIVRVAGGFVVGWVDARDGNGEVYAARLGSDLERTGREERITKAPGDATDVSLAVLGDKVIAVWADPRESPSDGFADIYAASLSAKDAKPTAPDTRILATAAHSRSPTVAVSEGAVVAVWIEEVPTNAATAGSDSYGAMIAKLDAAAKPIGNPVRLHFPTEGVATSISLDPSSKGLRGVVAQSTPVEVVLSIFTVAGTEVTTLPLIALDGPPSLDVPLALVQNDLVFGDDGPEPGDARLRRATLELPSLP